ATITCEDGTSVTITDGETGASGEACTLVDNNNGTATVTCGENTTTIGDSDDDGISDWQDNCPSTTNADQEDTNNDGIGDACAADYEGQGPLVPAILAIGIELENDELGVPVIVPADGVDGEGNPISVDIYGLDFRYGMSARLIENEAGDFDAAVDGVIDNPMGGDPLLKVYPLELTYVDASLMTFTLPVSPLVTDGTTSERTGDLKVQIVTNSGAINTVGVSWGEIDDNVDQLTYVTSSQNSGGLSATLALRGDNATAFDTVFPGQSGILVDVTLSNNTGGTIGIDSIDDGSISWSGSTSGDAIDSAVYDFHATNIETLDDIAHGESATLVFVVAFSQELSGFGHEKISASVVLNTSARDSYYSDGLNPRSITASATDLFTSGNAPSIELHGGSSQSVDADAGNGGNFTAYTQSNFNMGDLSAVDKTLPTIPATLDSSTALSFTNTDNSTDDIDSMLTPTGGNTGILFASTAEPRILSDGNCESSQPNKIIIIKVEGDIYMDGANWQIATETGTNCARISAVHFLADGEIVILNSTFDFRGDDVSAANADNEDGTDLVFISNADNDDVNIEGVTIIDSIFNLQGGHVFSAAASSAGSLTISGVDTDTNGVYDDGATGPIRIVSTDSATQPTRINTQGATSHEYTAGAAGSINLYTRFSSIEISDDVVLNAAGGQSSYELSDDAGNGGAINIDANADAGSLDSNNGDAGLVRINGQVISSGGDVMMANNTTASNAGNGGAVYLRGEEIHIGDDPGSGTAGNPVISSNGGSNLAPGTDNLGGDAGAMLIELDSDNNDDGSFNINNRSGLVAIGGAAAHAAGDGDSISVNAISTNASTNVHSVNGHLISSGGWSLVDPLNSTTGSAGDAGSISLQTNAGLEIGGAILARGGSAAAQRGFAQNPSAVNGGNGANITLDTHASDGPGANAPLTLTGIVDGSGGATLSGNAGNSETVTIQANATLDLSSTGKVLNNGGTILIDESLSGSAGTINISSDLGDLDTTPANITISGLVSADGGTPLQNAQNFATCGSINISSNGLDADNNGDIVISGALRARGDPSASATNIGIAGASESDIAISGSIETFEITTNAQSATPHHQAQISITTGGDGNIDLSSDGTILGNRSSIVLEQSDLGSGAITLNGTIVNDHRDTHATDSSEAYEDGAITVNARNNTTANAIVVGASALLQCNAGNITLDSDPDSDNSGTGNIVIGDETGGPELNASATENSIHFQHAINRNESGGTIKLKTSIHGTIQVVAGSLKADGTDISQDNEENDFGDESTASSLGKGGGIEFTAGAIDASDSAISMSANGAQNATGNSNLGTAFNVSNTQSPTADTFFPDGGDITFQVLDGTDPAGIVIANTGGISADGGNRGDGGHILLAFESTAAAPLSITGSGIISATGGNSTFVDSNGQSLQPGHGGTLTLHYYGTDQVLLTKTIHLSGGNNAGGPGGTGGEVSLQVSGVDEDLTTTVGGSWDFTGGASTGAHGVGGSGGRLEIGDNIVGHIQ
ncbi:MAG: thrombospondin type 3 repeat-containing protein, partial [Myxococcota bacterium]|nr:thrombospondin type 3 repeat-containing protein [Myxococcota bacterium]